MLGYYSNYFLKKLWITEVGKKRLCKPVAHITFSLNLLKCSPHYILLSTAASSYYHSNPTILPRHWFFRLFRCSRNFLRLLFSKTRHGDLIRVLSALEDQFGKVVTYLPVMYPISSVHIRSSPLFYNSQKFISWIFWSRVLAKKERWAV